MWESTSVSLSASGIKVRRERRAPTPAASRRSRSPCRERHSSSRFRRFSCAPTTRGYARRPSADHGDESAPRGSCGELRPALGRRAQSARRRASHVRASCTAIGVSDRRHPVDVDEVLHALDAPPRHRPHEIASLHLLSADGATLHLRGDRGLRPRLREINRVLPTGQGAHRRRGRHQRRHAGRTISESVKSAPGGAGGPSCQKGSTPLCVPIHSRGRILGAHLARPPPGVHRIRIARARQGVRQPDRPGPAERAALGDLAPADDLKSAEAQLIEGGSPDSGQARGRSRARDAQSPDRDPPGRRRLLLMEKTGRSARAASGYTIVQASARPNAQTCCGSPAGTPPERHPAVSKGSSSSGWSEQSPPAPAETVKVVTDFGDVRPVTSPTRSDPAGAPQSPSRTRRRWPNTRASARDHRAAVRARRAQRVGVWKFSTGGIHPNVLPRIFEAFHRDEGARRGTGARPPGSLFHRGAAPRSAEGRATARKAAPPSSSRLPAATA